MMLSHLIQHRGKGMWVFLAPLFTGFFFALIFDGLNLQGKYLPPSAILLSSIIIWLIDNKTRAKEPVVRQRIRNTLMWIDMKYWAFALGAFGIILSFAAAFNYIT